MPFLNISLIEGRTLEQKRTLLNITIDALIKSFGINSNSCSGKINEYKKEDFLLPPSKDEGHIIIEVTCFLGRTVQQKKAFYQLATRSIKSIGENEKNVIFVIHEEQLVNWAIAGGQIASEFFIETNNNILDSRKE